MNNSVRKKVKRRIYKWKQICEEICNEHTIQELWANYKREYSYAKDILFDDVMNVVEEIGEKYLNLSTLNH